MTDTVSPAKQRRIVQTELAEILSTTTGRASELLDLLSKSDRAKVCDLCLDPTPENRRQVKQITMADIQRRADKARQEREAAAAKATAGDGDDDSGTTDAEMLTAGKLAKALEVDGDQVKAWTEAGMPVHRDGNKTRYNLVECQDWLADQAGDGDDDSGDAE